MATTQSKNGRRFDEEFEREVAALASKPGAKQEQVARDHVHLLVSAPPLLAPAKLVQYLKGSSSRRLQEEFPALRKRSRGQPLWARGYFCATVGAVDEKTIKRYIKEQKWDDEDGEGQFRVVGGK